MPESIMFVDDDENLVFIFREIVSRMGFKTTTFTDSQNALDTFKTKPDEFDLIITDFSMPKMLGTELALEIKKINPAIPIILCSGLEKNNIIDENTMKKSGIREFLPKPLTTAVISKLLFSYFPKN